jgi:Cyclic nucleotide-binding domain/Major Facilitator Superfamily
LPVRARLSPAAAALRDVMRNPSIRRIELGWTMGTAADWAFLVVLLVFVYDAGGTLAVGVLGAVRTVPAMLAAPFASTLVHRYRGDRVLTAINVVRCSGAVLTAIAIAVDLPIAVVYLLAALVAGAGSLVRPIQTALLPAFAQTPRELVAANVASSTGEGVGTFVGPLLAGLVVVGTGSAATSVLVAVTFAGAAAAVTGIHFEHAADARGGGGSERARGLQLARVLRVLRRYPGPTLVAGDFVAQTFVRGLLVTLVVVSAIELLGMGDSGVGLLNAAIGLGGLTGALGALGLTGGPGLARVFTIALAAWGLPLILIGAWPTVALALVALFVTGLSNALLDVSGFTLVQRGVRIEDRLAMFGVMEGLFGLGLLVGSLVGPALVAIVGARGSLAVAGAILPILALVTWRPIASRTRRSPRVEERLALLRSNPLFAPLPLTALDRLAESVVPVSFVPGEALMREGERGDSYLVIENGEVEASAEGCPIAMCGPGDGVGEIALLRNMPRTATVVARTPVQAYAIDAESFLAAVSGPAAAAAAEAVTSSRLARSLPPSAPA